MIENFLNKIICGDCLQVIPTLPDSSIDLCITSPPYNVSLKGYDAYQDLKGHEKYLQWLTDIFKILHSKMKKGGRIAINVGDGCNGKVHTHVDITELMCRIGYLHMTTIVWNKNNSSNRFSWGSFRSPVNPSFPTPFEYVMIFAKESFRLQEKGVTDLTKDEFIRWSSSLWEFEKSDYKRSTRLIRGKSHPAPFPVELPARLIKMLSWKGAVVLDPFIGSGSTALASKNLERKYIGIDVSKKYCRIAENALNQIRLITGSLFED
jgi:site-specific DNA-methyltransferase (adenine-specific)